MNERDQQIALAEYCGWTRQPNGYFFGPNAPKVSMPGYQGVKSYNLPDYLRDINVMQKAIIDHICGDKEIEVQFLKELNAIIDGYADSEDVPIICEYNMAMICAPCWALAKAFLRTIGKWKESATTPSA